MKNTGKNTGATKNKKLHWFWWHRHSCLCCLGNTGKNAGATKDETKRISGCISN